MNSVAGELGNLKGVKIKEVNESYISFFCEKNFNIMFLNSICDSIKSEYGDKASAEITLQDGICVLTFLAFEDINQVVMSFASSVDAAACDYPKFYKLNKQEK